MWRVIKETNFLTGKTCFVIEKKSGVFFKSWTRSYRIGNTSFSSPVKSYTKERAFSIIEALRKGNIIDKSPVDF